MPFSAIVMGDTLVFVDGIEKRSGKLRPTFARARRIAWSSAATTSSTFLSAMRKASSNYAVSFGSIEARWDLRWCANKPSRTASDGSPVM